MPRRRQSEPNVFNVLFETLQIAPIWVGPLLAGMMYSAMKWLIPWWLEPSGDATDIAQSMNSTLAMFSAMSAKFAGMLIVAAWIIVEVRKWIDRDRLDQQTGIDSIRELSWTEFEKLLCEAFRREGYKVEHTGTDGPDGGIDIRLRKDETLKLVQCKHWKRKQVGVGVVREMLGLVTSETADEGIVVTSGQFTDPAWEFAEQNRIRLIDGGQLEKMISMVQKRNAVGSLDSNPEPSSPPCPNCNGQMVVKTARRGRNAGTNFWGCQRFPACRGTRNMDRG